MLPGVILGASLADSLGGYRGKSMRNALSLSSGFNFVTLITCIVISRVPEMHLYLAMLWICCVSFGCTIPVCFGIVVGCVPKSAQNTASAVYNLIFNFGALGIAPIVTGSIIDGYQNQREGMIAGYRAILYMSLITPVLLLLAKC